MALMDCLTIIGISLFSGLVSEGMSWLLIYRTDSYKRLKRNIERISKQVESKKSEVVVAAKQKQHGKILSRLETELSEANRSMSMMKMKSMLFLSTSMLAVFGVLSSMFEGQVVAKLPFEPFSLIRGMSHRSLPGEDPTDCAFIFIYILSSFGLRSSLQKALGIQPPNSAGSSNSLFAPPPETR